MGDQPLPRPLPTHRTTQTQNKGTETSTPQVELEPTIPVFEWAKTVHALDRADTVIGKVKITIPIKCTLSKALPNLLLPCQLGDAHLVYNALYGI
jgi:hypothetical protein